MCPINTPATKLELEGNAYDIAIEYMDKLFTYFSDYEEINIHKTIWNKITDSKQRKIAFQVQDEIEKLLYDKFYYAEKTKPNNYYGCLTSLGREVKAAGGHIAYLKKNEQETKANLVRQSLSDQKLRHDHNIAEFEEKQGQKIKPMKVFISFLSNPDRKKMDLLKILIENQQQNVIPIVIDYQKTPGMPLTEKVENGINQCDVFIPIITRNSINSQWVNQEIGYAKAKERKCIPIIEKGILKDLKGFIHDKIDCPFLFQGNDKSARSETVEYNKCILKLVNYLPELSLEPKLTSSITPKKIKQGEKYTTTVEFVGSLKNGFFDNLAKHQLSDFKIWNWDYNTIDNSQKKTPGNLHGNVKTSSSYSWDTSNWPIGKFNIYVRVYDHPIPGEPTRIRIAEEVHEIEIIPNKN